MSVTVTGFHSQVNSEGEPYFSLQLQGGVEILKSNSSGKYYAAALKTRLVTSFNEEMCRSLVGSKLPGRIEKIRVEPYEWTNPQTGEVILLRHRYEYNPVEEPVEAQPADNGQPVEDDLLALLK